MQTDDALKALAEARSALAPVARSLATAPSSDDEAATSAVLTAVREVQRLVEGVVTEILRLSARGDAPLPAESLLGGSGTVPRSQVHAEVARARVADDFPALAESHRNGQAHTGNIDVLARITRAMSKDELAAMVQHDEALADAARRLGDESFRKRVSRLRDKIRADAGNTAAQQAVDDSFAHVAPNRERSSFQLHGSFDPIRGAGIKAALAREAKFLTEHPELCRGMTPAQVAAQALHDLVLRGDGADRAGAPRPSIRIHVLADRDTMVSGPYDNSIAETFDGLPIGPATLGRLCCEATMRRIDTAPDGEVHVSRIARSPSETQRVALRALYPVCPISGAGWESIEIHHVIFFNESRRTVLDELVPISRRWHHLIHDGGWKLEMGADRTLRLSRPDGTLFQVIPPPVPINVWPSATPSCSVTLATSRHQQAA